MSVANSPQIIILTQFPQVEELYIFIGNHMNPSAIWLIQHIKYFFQRLTKWLEPIGPVQFVVFENFYECFCIPNCRRKIMWLLINYTHEKISHEAFTAFFLNCCRPKFLNICVQYLKFILFNIFLSQWFSEAQDFQT